MQLSLARRAGAATALAAVAATAACSSAGGAQAGGQSPVAGRSGRASSSTASVAPASSPASSAPAGTAVSPATLGARIEKGLAGIRSAHLDGVVSAAGQRITLAADERRSGGRVQALRATSSAIPGVGAVALVVADGHTYAKVPRSISGSAKPYVLLSTASSNARVRQLATALGGVLGSASTDLLSGLTAALTSAREIGPATVAGTAATRYRVVVDTAKLPASFPGRSLLQAGGLTQLAADVYLDRAGRPLRVTETLTVAGSPASVDVSISRVNEPVTITAPPASEVAGG